VLWSPHQKKAKSSNIEQTVSESVQSNTDEQTHTCGPMLSTDLSLVCTIVHLTFVV